jgi:hypothetical protein
MTASQTTAIYPNRAEDKQELEAKIGLAEFGDEETEFYLPDGSLFAKGYVRVVYGDHGPYVEFDKTHLRATLRSKFGNAVDYDNLPDTNHRYYYFWLVPNNNLQVKVYLQIKPVSNLPNAPKREDGKKSNFNREEGYADYKRGMFYVDPYQIQVRKANEVQEASAI